MPEIVRSLGDMLSQMSPARVDGTYVFASFANGPIHPDILAAAIASFREREGLSLILPLDVAQSHELPDTASMVCITLNVYSDLEGIGLTAAVARALAENGIACNMVAAFHHDHAFVPKDEADRALRVLEQLQADARGCL